MAVRKTWTPAEGAARSARSLSLPATTGRQTQVGTGRDPYWPGSRCLPREGEMPSRLLLSVRTENASVRCCRADLDAVQAQSGWTVTSWLSRSGKTGPDSRRLGVAHVPSEAYGGDRGSEGDAAQ